MRKVPTNLSVRADLVRRARALGLDLSEVLEASLERAIRDAERAAWQGENGDAIDEYNAQVEQHGMFGDAWRRF